MCKEQPAVKALRYLQTEVSDVVDHTNPGETSVFQSLLMHLLSPSAVISAGGPTWVDPAYPCVDAGQTSRAVFQMDKDPDHPVGTWMRDEPKAVSVERFGQRTEMYETLLGFVEEVKQPKGSLLDLNDAEDGL